MDDQLMHDTLDENWERLAQLVGELVLTRNELLQLVSPESDSPFAGPIARLDRIVTELDDLAKKSRMQPLRDAFRPLPRLVRELACITGKPMELDVQGGETELDHSLLEAIKTSLPHIIRNAAEHGIEIPAARQSLGKPSTGRLTVAAIVEDTHVVLSIQDDGAGVHRQRVIQQAIEHGLIADEQASLLTDADIVQLILRPGFTTVEDVTTNSGRGVGLDVVRTLIEGIGGVMEITSVPGRGTNVRLKIPLTPGTAVEQAPDPETLPALLPLNAGETSQFTPCATPLRALVIDDSMFFRQLLRAALEAEGYGVTLADAAESAMELLQRHNRFDVILCDIEMSGMDGCQFAEWFRGRPELHDIPLVAVTSLDAEIHRDRILAAGFDRLLTKFNPQQLRETLVELLNRTSVALSA